MLMRLALRDQERHRPEGGIGIRSAIGIYLGWNGDPRAFFGEVVDVQERLHFLEAQGDRESGRLWRCGGCRSPHHRCNKDPDRRSTQSPLVLVGHSMGALVLEAAFLKLLSEDDPSFIRRPTSLRVRSRSTS